jgi:hypothetical protein
VADPADITVYAADRWLLADRGDKVIKVLSRDGDIETIGRPGKGPGEFQALAAAGVMGADVFAYDLVARTLSWFDRDGDLTASLPLASSTPAPFVFWRNMDDSLFVASGWIAPGKVPTVHLFDRSGHEVRSFLRLDGLMRDLTPEAYGGMGVMADGADEMILTALFGHDTVFVHDARGRLRASGRLTADTDLPLLRLPDLVRENGGSMRRANGSWLQDDHLAVRNVVALGDDLWAIQLAYAGFGTDFDLLVDGGPVIIASYDGTREVRMLGSMHVPGALLGKDGDGNGLVLHWRGRELATLDLLRLRITTDVPSDSVL